MKERILRIIAQHDAEMAAILIDKLIEREIELAFMKGEMKQLNEQVKEERESLEKFREQNFNA